jgi:4-hydroxybenzoyl-CoA thioesterase
VLKRAENLGETRVDYSGPYPMTYRRRVAWGDCDPAGIIYTPRILDVAMEMLERWTVDVLGVSWDKLNNEMSMGAPTVRTEIDFIAAPKPDDYIVSELAVEAIGRSSVTYRVTGTDGQGLVYYQCKIISCFIERPDFRAADIPAIFLLRIQAYQKGCNEA